MTTFLNRIREDSLAARKAREGDKATFLITLLAEASRPGKDAGNRDSTDGEVIAVLKKFLKNTDDTLKALGDTAPAASARLALERDILVTYLPQQVGAVELAASVKELVGNLPEKSLKQVGVVMAQLQARFDGNFDKAAASQLIRAELAG